MTTALQPSKGMPVLSINVIQPEGVHGANAVSRYPVAILPWFKTDSPSTSFSSLTALVTMSSSIFSSQSSGIWTMIP